MAKKYEAKIKCKQHLDLVERDGGRYYPTCGATMYIDSAGEEAICQRGHKQVPCECVNDEDWPCCFGGWKWVDDFNHQV